MKTHVIILSPAKKLDYETDTGHYPTTTPHFSSESNQLIQFLRKLSQPDIQFLMGVSKNLAEINFKRYRDWHSEPSKDHTRPAVLAFKGDVYQGLEALSFSPDDMQWCQTHLRILSGLYGVLRPLDLIQPYRLEMSTRLKTSTGNNLYQFWGDSITENINQQLTSINASVVVNLASHEYSKVLIPSRLKARVVTPVFLNWSKGQYKNIGLYAKKARGRMGAWIIKRHLENPQKLIEFDCDSYRYNSTDSEPDKPVFTRRLNGA